MSVIRYTMSRCFRSQRWIVPVVAFILVVGLLYASGRAPFQTTGMIGALLLVPAGAWMTLAAINSEDTGQSAVTNVNGRGIIRVRLSVLLAAYFVCSVLAVVSVVASIISDTRFNTRQDRFSVIGMLILAHLINAAMGITMGALVSKPVIERTGYAWLLVALFFVVSLIIPGSPVRGTLVLLLRENVPADAWSTMNGLVVTAVAIAAVLGVLMSWTLRRRS
jgi:hypothetical protein